ncbi:MAG: MBL fold metallo-hydrolase [Elusimicrobia bacterium]|nr:MBL fold metallo-hydrolase [Candidatus Obscuribacterium magneticum]
MSRLRRHLLFLFILGGAGPASAATLIHVIDVGFGLAVHIEADDLHYLIDTGTPTARSKVLRHLAECGVTRLSAVFLTHAHPDHAGGLEALVTQIPTDAVYWNGLPPLEVETAAALRAAQKIVPFIKLGPGVTVALSDTLSLSTLKSSHPTEDYNDQALAFGLKRGSVRLLFFSDASPPKQKNLLDENPEWIKSASWILWPHHGDAMQADLLAALKKVRTAVVSVGPNPYGLPSPDVENEAWALGAKLLRTDRDGDLKFSVNRKVLLVR